MPYQTHEPIIKYRGDSFSYWPPTTNRAHVAAMLTLINDRYSLNLSASQPASGANKITVAFMEANSAKVHTQASHMHNLSDASSERA